VLVSYSGKKGGKNCRKVVQPKKKSRSLLSLKKVNMEKEHLCRETGRNDTRVGGRKEMMKLNKQHNGRREDANILKKLTVGDFLTILQESTSPCTPGRERETANGCRSGGRNSMRKSWFSPKHRQGQPASQPMGEEQ